MGHLPDVHVLHVDDEPDFTDIVADFLEREDNRLVVETTTSASEGLDRLADEDFDCIISDYDMPEQNGIEFLETVREMAPDLPFILFTGKGSEEVAGDAISAGVTDYLQKERGTDQYAVLANRVRNAVERYRAEHARERQRKASETAHEGISILNEEGEFDGAKWGNFIENVSVEALPTAIVATASIPAVNNAEPSIEEAVVRLAAVMSRLPEVDRIAA